MVIKLSHHVAKSSNSKHVFVTNGVKSWVWCIWLYTAGSLRKATLQLMCFFVLSHLDYCNFAHWHHFWSNVPPSKNSKSCSQSHFFCKSKHEHVTPLCKKLCWLQVKERILFKIATFAFHFFDGTLPPYLSSCLFVYTPSRTLRSSSDEKNSFLC